MPNSIAIDSNYSELRLLSLVFMFWNCQNTKRDCRKALIYSLSLCRKLTIKHNSCLTVLEKTPIDFLSFGSCPFYIIEYSVVQIIIRLKRQNDKLSDAAKVGERFAWQSVLYLLNFPQIPYQTVHKRRKYCDRKQKIFPGLTKKALNLQLGPPLTRPLPEQRFALYHLHVFSVLVHINWILINCWVSEKSVNFSL